MNKIVLALIADRRCAIPAAVTLCSAVEHNRGKIGKVYLFSTDYAPEDLSVMEAVCGREEIDFRMIKVDERLLLPYANLSAWSKFTFIKVLIPKLLYLCSASPDGPELPERMLYLDIDMLVTGDLSLAFNMDMEGNAVSAVPDIPVVREDNRRCGLPDDNPYINTGFMLMDMEKWVAADQEGLFEKAIERLKRMNPPFINDQDVINTVFYHACQPLSLKFNLTSQAFGIHSLYCLKEFRSAWREGRRHPAVIHFTNSRKPWSPAVFHLYKGAWFRVLRTTPYRNRLPYCKLSGPAMKNWCITEMGRVLDFFRLRESK